MDWSRPTLYNFNPDSTYIPAFALHGIVQTGYGADTPSTQYTLRAIASKYLGDSTTAPRLHVNMQWTHVTGALADERSDQYVVLVGYSQLLTRKLAVVADFVHGQQPNFRKTEDVIDLGLNYEISDRWSIAGGVGAGVAQQSPDHRIFLAFQRNFQLF